MKFVLEREERDRAGRTSWKRVFYPVCADGRMPEPLQHGDSQRTTAIVSQYPDELSHFRFPATPTTYRLVLTITTEPSQAGGPSISIPLDERVSNTFVIEPP